MKLTIIIPVYNEERTISQIIAKVKKLNLGKVRKEIIVVDDGSTDKTVSNIKTAGIKLIKHKKNKGKGAAIITGIGKATGDFIVIQDADLEYDPKYIKQLIKPIEKGVAEVVYGSRINRMPNGKFEKTPRMLFHYVANRTLSLMASIMYQSWVTDIETCYKIFPKDAFRKSPLKSSDFKIEVEITSKLLKSGHKILELPIQTDPRGYDEGKKFKTFEDGFGAFIGLIKYRFKN